MMDLLIAYDQMGAEARETQPVLPEREWIDTHATDTECYEAMKRVTAAAYPFGPDLLRIVPEFLPMILNSLTKGAAAATLALVSSGSTRRSRRNTESGRPETSRSDSPTSSSTSMPKKRGRARKPKPSTS